MKDVELRLVSELMKNSRRSDRELAKAIGASQPTITRIRAKLEKEGIIREYTMIPDFSRLGFKILSLTFIKRSKEVTAGDLEKVVKLGKEATSKGLKNILTMRGMGMGYDVAIVSLHEDYSSYSKLLEDVRQFPYSDLLNIQSFLIDLEDRIQYRNLTLSELAKYIPTMGKDAK